MARSHNSILLLAVTAFLAACAAPGPPPKVMPPIAAVSEVCAARATTVVQSVKSGEAAQAVDRVIVTADPESAASLVARGWESSRAGDRDTTVALFDLALTRRDGSMTIDRIQWSYGWAMFNLRDHQCALAHFEEARKTAPDKVSWMPQTLAVTYWQLGERDVAVRWYDRAAKNEPACWIDAKAAARCSRYWLQQERRALGELLTEWKRWRIEGADRKQ